MSHSFIQNLLDNSTSFISSKMKDLCQQWKLKGVIWNSLMAWL